MLTIQILAIELLAGLAGPLSRAVPRISTIRPGVGWFLSKMTSDDLKGTCDHLKASDLSQSVGGYNPIIASNHGLELTSKGQRMRYLQSALARTLKMWAAPIAILAAISVPVAHADEADAKRLM